MKILPMSMPKSMPTAKNNNSPSFGYRLGMISEAQVHYGVSEDFKYQVAQAISQYPSRYVSLIQNNDYRIVLAPSLNAALLLRDLANSSTLIFEKEYPRNSFYMQLNRNKNLKEIIIAEKRPFSQKYTKNVVNFALSAALSEILKLDKNPDILDALQKDVSFINKTQKLKDLTPKEILLLQEELMTRDRKIKILEILPDLIAWNLGAGKYGSGLYEVNNPSFMKTLFPTTSACLKRYVW